jgi:uncharacterized membrane protein YgcG
LRELQFGAYLEALLGQLTARREHLAERSGRRVPLAVKIAPDMSPDELRQEGAILVARGIDAVIATNTTVARDGVADARHATEAGGLSGAPLRERSFGLWQRLAAAFGALLSAALLVTVSWRTVPVYDAPDFIYLAAWSPLIIAGAPVYSVDGHLASDAWRRLGPRVTLWDLRRRVLRRGTVLATVVIGLTLLVGSVLGAGVRASSTHTGRPGPQVTPTNNLPGSPLPEVSGGDSAGTGSSPAPASSAPAHKKARQQPATHSPSATASHRPTSSGSTGTSGSGSPTSSTPTHSGGSSSGGGGQPPPTHSAPTQAPPPAQPSPKPTQGGAIGGLLGSQSPTGLLLGLPSGGAGGSSGAPEGSA